MQNNKSKILSLIFVVFEYFLYCIYEICFYLSYFMFVSF